MYTNKSIFTPVPESTLSSCMCVFNADGNIESDSKGGSKEDLRMPMASTVKVAIALTLAKHVIQGTLSLSTVYTLEDEDLVPGLPISFLDKLFYNPEQIKIEVTLQEMLTNMIKTSDNTSTDYILKLIGGPNVVNQLVTDELGIKNFNFKSTLRELLSSYYQFPCIKTSENIETAKQALQTAFEMRTTENTFFNEGMDSCSAKAMVELLSKIAFPNQNDNPRWLISAAPLVLETMKLCETNTNKLKKGVYDSNIANDVRFCAGKTGGLGTISNDVGIVKITSDHKDFYIIIAVYSCLSKLSLPERDELIAKTTKDLINQSSIFEYALTL